jgi:hypothetical protein
MPANFSPLLNSVLRQDILVKQKQLPGIPPFGAKKPRSQGFEKLHSRCSLMSSLQWAATSLVGGSTWKRAQKIACTPSKTGHCCPMRQRSTLRSRSAKSSHWVGL